MQRPGQYAPLQGHSAYDVLGVEPDASHAEIDAARKRLVRRLHPDLPSGDAAKMSLVNIAAGILLDRTRRAAYDRYLDSFDDDRAIGYDADDDFDDDFGDRQVRRPAGDRRSPVPPAETYRPGDPPASPRFDDAIPAQPGDASRSRRSGDPTGRRSGDTVPAGDPTGRRSGHTVPAGRAGDPGATRRSGATAPAGRPADGAAVRRSGDTGRTAVPPARRAARSGAARSGAPRSADPPSIEGRAPLAWQPPPPGPLARWHSRRAESRRISRGQKSSPSRGPMVVLGLFVFVIVLCAVGGALIGYTAGGSAGPTPAPTRTEKTQPPRTPAPKTTKPH